MNKKLYILAILLSTLTITDVILAQEIQSKKILTIADNNTVKINEENSNELEKAKNFVDNLTKQVLTTIQSRESDDEKSKKLSHMFVDNVDVNWMAHFTVGQKWKKASEEQQKKFLEHYEQFLIASYVPNFKKYNSDIIKIKSAKKIDDNQYVVSTVIDKSSGDDINVDYMVHFINDTPKIFDIVGEGISLINTERADFRSILQQSDLDSLTKSLQDKIVIMNSKYTNK